MTESLITLLSQAETPSRELDLAFHKALGKCPEDARLISGQWEGRCLRYGAPGQTYVLPPYFTSGGIPAELLAEVPEGCKWLAIGGLGPAKAAVNLHKADAATPALALGIAILRTREGEKG